MDMNALQKAWSRTKIQLMSHPDTVFFTTVLFSLQHAWEPKIPTAQVNGLHLKINPDFYMSLDEPERLFLCLHEVGHVIFLHCLKARMGNRCPDKWNRAADYVVNAMLVERGFRLPKGGLHDDKFKGLSTEQVYDLLPDNPGMPLPMQDLDPSAGEDPEDGTGSGSKVEDAVAEILVRAALQSKMANDKPGTIPGDVEIFLDRLLRPKLPWYRLLYRHLTAKVKEDFSWRKPSRRYFPEFHMPSLHSEGLAHLAFFVDASGSVSDADFLRFVSEIGGVMKQFRPQRLTLVQFDTRIIQVDEITSMADLMRVKFYGRGGTSIQPVYDWIREHTPTASLVFTDGYFRQVSGKLPTDLIWLIHNNRNFQGASGTTIHYDI